MAIKIIAVIPARSGSKGIPDKNIQLINGVPLLSIAIRQAKQINNIDKVIVSTDSQIYAKIAIQEGAEVIIRPASISGDLSLDIEVFKHLLSVLNSKENYSPDVIIHLRATYPTRKLNDVNNALRLFLDNFRQNIECSSVRSVIPSKKSVYKKYFKTRNGTIIPCIENYMEYCNFPRQLLIQDFEHNGCVDIISADVIGNGSMVGSCILPYIMNEENNDIDTFEDLKRIERLINLQKYNKKSLTSKYFSDVFCFDIDGIICTTDCNNLNYDEAQPIEENINLINFLYKKGCKIYLYTARGSETGINWVDETREQLNKWNVKYHELRFNKPGAEYYIDDRFIDINELRKMVLDDE